MPAGDKARGDWTPWPVVDGQLELPAEINSAEDPDRPDQHQSGSIRVTEDD
jgi:hypothetical protein